MTVLGLRDILDDAESFKKTGEKRMSIPIWISLYDEIWVYGNRDIYDPIEMYKIPEKIHNKLSSPDIFPARHSHRKAKASVRKKYRIMDDDKFVLITTGGGGDGMEVIDHYLAMHDYFPTSLPFKSIIITGPFMPKDVREAFRKRAKNLALKLFRFTQGWRS